MVIELKGVQYSLTSYEVQLPLCYNIFIWSGSLFQVEKQKQKGLYVSFCTRHRHDAI